MFTVQTIYRILKYFKHIGDTNVSRNKIEICILLLSSKGKDIYYNLVIQLVNQRIILLQILNILKLSLTVEIILKNCVK